MIGQFWKLLSKLKGLFLIILRYGREIYSLVSYSSVGLSRWDCQESSSSEIWGQDHCIESSLL